MLHSEVMGKQIDLREKLANMAGLMHGVQDIMMSDEPYEASVGEQMLNEIIADIAELEVKLERYEFYLNGGFISLNSQQQVAPIIFDCIIAKEEVPF